MRRAGRPSPLPDIWTQRLRSLGSVRLGPDVAQVAYMVVGGLAGLAVGIGLAVGGDSWVPTLVGVVIAGLGAALLAYTGADLAQGKLTMTVTPEGLQVGPRTFAWSDVVGVGAARSGRSALVALHLTPEAAARLPRHSRHGQRFYLPPVSRVSGPTLVAWLSSVHAAARSDPPTPTG